MPKYKTTAKKVNCITIIVTIRSIRINIEVKQLKEQLKENIEKYKAESIYACT